MIEKLTVEEAWAAVERYGGQRAAARELGVPHGTFSDWLRPEVHRERSRRHFWANREKERIRDREKYQNLTEFQLNKRRLQQRRHFGLKRMAERNRIREEQRGSIPPQG